mgnify:CR=1 FL=1
MAKITLDEYRKTRNEKKLKMLEVRDYLESNCKNKSQNNKYTSDSSAKNSYRSGSRHRDPEKRLLLYKMMIRSRNAKLEKIGERRYRLKI